MRNMTIAKITTTPTNAPTIPKVSVSVPALERDAEG